MPGGISGKDPPANAGDIRDAGSIPMKESISRQIDKKSRGPQGEWGLEFSRRKKGQTFFPLYIPWRRKWQSTPVLIDWKIPWTEEPGRLQSMGSQRVGHD